MNFYMMVQEDVEAEMRRLKLELKQTMEMYSTACKEALTAKQKVRRTNRLTRIDIKTSFRWLFHDIYVSRCRRSSCNAGN